MLAGSLPNAVFILWCPRARSESGVGALPGTPFMETIVERPAAPDVHKASVMACVRVPGAAGGRDEHVEQFPTTVQGLLRSPTGWRRMA